MVAVEIIAIGNEVLLGDVLDSNSNWLCKRVTGLGGEVQRVTIVRDKGEAIASALHGSLKRGADLIITTGGLGPTDDDMTLRAIAEGLGLSPELNEEALAIVQTRYRELAEEGYVADDRLTEARRKMAHFPKGATPIFNPVGTAPACALRVGSTLLVSLPGVPEELMGIWEGPLQPLVGELFGEGFYEERALLVDCKDESLLAPILRRVSARHPKVYIKSRAQKFGPGVRIKVTFSASGEREEQVRQAIEEPMEEARRALRAAGLKSEMVDG